MSPMRIHEITVTRETYIVVDDTGANRETVYTGHADLSCTCGHSASGTTAEMDVEVKLHLEGKRKAGMHEYALNLRTP